MIKIGSTSSKELQNAIAIILGRESKPSLRWQRRNVSSFIGFLWGISSGAKRGALGVGASRRPASRFESDEYSLIWQIRLAARTGQLSHQRRFPLRIVRPSFLIQLRCGSFGQGYEKVQRNSSTSNYYL